MDLLSGFGNLDINKEIDQREPGNPMKIGDLVRSSPPSQRDSI